MARTREVESGVMLAKPLTFMNLSGTPVSVLVRYYRIPLDDLLIVAEDVNLPLGRLRARARGSDGGHNGLRSVIDALGTQTVPRLRVGVGRGDTRRDLAAHVLARFETSERPAIREAVVQAADAVEAFIVEGIGPVMNRFNGPPGQRRRCGRRRTDRGRRGVTYGGSEPASMNHDTDASPSTPCHAGGRQVQKEPYVSETIRARLHRVARGDR